MVHYNWGLLLAEDRQLDAAIAHYREALRLDPGYAKARTNLGWALAAQGRLEEAVVEYREALRLRPDLAAAHNNLAVVFEDLGRLDDAIVHYGEAVRLTSGDARARFNLASALHRAGRFDEAIAAYRAMGGRDGAAPEVQHALARALAARGDARAAVGGRSRKPSWPGCSRPTRTPACATAGRPSSSPSRRRRRAAERTPPCWIHWPRRTPRRHGSTRPC
jgi:tetratricopeptide (TPR) repeat protein